MISNLKLWYSGLATITIVFCVTSYVHLNRFHWHTPIFTIQETTNTTNLPTTDQNSSKISMSKSTSPNGVFSLEATTADSQARGSLHKRRNLQEGFSTRGLHQEEGGLRMLNEGENGPVRTANKPGTGKSKADQWKVILLYTQWWGLQWPEVSMWLSSKNKCPVKCRLTTNRGDWLNSDAVMFHGPDMPRDVQYLNNIRISKQPWIYFTMENPYNSGHDAALFNGLFNWTMTFRRESDIYLPYGELRQLSSENTSHQRTANYAKGKTRLIAWAVSHCNTIGKRDQLVQDLAKYVPVSVYGKCSHLFPKRDNINEEECLYNDDKCSNRLKKFKFYLALENAICLDYITEKYWKTPLVNNMVPIVIGPEYYSKLAIPGSYINVLDFPSIEALAIYIKYLDKNDTAYNEYFRWKSQYKVYETPWTLEYLCKVCTKLHRGTHVRKVYTDLGSFWSKNTCTYYLRKLKRFTQI